MNILGFWPYQRHQLVVKQEQAEQYILNPAYLGSDHSRHLVAYIELHRVRIDAAQQHAVVVVEAFNDVCDELLCAGQLVSKVVVGVLGENVLDELQGDYAEYLVVDVGELQFQLLDGLGRLAGHAYENEVAAVQEGDLVVAGDHVTQSVVVVAFYD